MMKGVERSRSTTRSKAAYAVRRGRRPWGPMLIITQASKNPMMNENKVEKNTINRVSPKADSS